VYNTQQTPLELEINPEELSGSGPPPGMHVTDDDYMLTKIRRSDYVEKYLSGEIVPDFLIDHLFELLNLLTEVGMQ
jgi:hypothetical protein